MEQHKDLGHLAAPSGPVPSAASEEAARPVAGAASTEQEAPRMDPAIKARWVAALRSGEYGQGKGVLRSGSGQFCCLGVLCDLAAKSGVGAWDGKGFVCGEFREVSVLPDAVHEWARFLETHYLGAPVVIDSRHDLLACHNDIGRTFAEIADAIEAQL